MDQKIFLYGVPGSGKTSFAKFISQKLNIPVIHADTMRKNIQKNSSKLKNPFLYLGTDQAYKEFGNLTPENSRKGLLAVRTTLQPFIIQQIKGFKFLSLILEGAFLDPFEFKKLGKVVLITTNNAQKHKKQYYSHLDKLLDFKNNGFKASRFNQNYLINEAKKLKISIIDNNSTFEEMYKLLF